MATWLYAVPDRIAREKGVSPPMGPLARVHASTRRASSGLCFERNVAGGPFNPIGEKGASFRKLAMLATSLPADVSRMVLAIC
jgi:hypothetical protein